VILKAAALFILLNVCYVLTQPLAWLSELTFYNSLLPGRERLPYSDNPADTYNISLHRIEGMYASHVIGSEEKGEDEFRVILLGDSAIWGWLLETNETMSACLNEGDYYTADGRRLVVYNLGYPVTSVLKDTLLLEEAMQYEVDGVAWFVTLQALYKDEQLRHPILQNNDERARDLIEEYDLALDTDRLPDEPDLLERTIIGQRRELADLLRHQVYGLAWTITGVDHTNPRFFQPPPADLQAGDNIPTRENIRPPLTGDDLALDVLAAAHDIASDNEAEILLVNEPIFITDGLNSETRYNDLYPRWAYDDYMQLMDEQVAQNDWHYVNIWNTVPPEAFTDYPLHYTAGETCRVAEMIAPQIVQLAK